MSSKTAIKNEFLTRTTTPGKGPVNFPIQIAPCAIPFQQLKECQIAAVIPYFPFKGIDSF